MKPFQIIVLAVFGGAALIGLLLFATFNGNSGPQAIGKVLIWGSLPKTEMEEVLGELKSADKRYSDVTYVEHSVNSFDADLATAIAEGRGPDLVLITQEQLQSARAKLTVIPFTSLPQRTFIDSYVPLSQLFLTTDGTYGIPFLVDPLVMYFNRGTLASAGLPTAPATWEGVNGLSQTLTKRSSAHAILKSTIALGEYGNIANARAVLSLLLLQAGSTIAADSGNGYESTLAGKGAVSTYAADALNFYTQFANPAKTVYSWNRSLRYSRDAFLAGDLALYPGYASERPFLSASNPNLDFDMARMPQLAGSENRITYGLVYAFAIPRISPNPSGAFSVAVALTGNAPETQASTALSLAPAATRLLTPPVNDRFAPVYYPEALTARGWLTPASVDSIFSSMISNVATGRKTTEEALQEADQSLTAALRQ